MTALADLLAVLGRSDLAPGLDPLWYRWITVTCTHVLVGVLLSLVPARWAWSVMLLLLAKELTFDLPIAGWSPRVMADSLIDFGAYTVGLMLGRWMQRSRAMNAADQANRK